MDAAHTDATEDHPQQGIRAGGQHKKGHFGLVFMPLKRLNYCDFSMQALTLASLAAVAAVSFTDQKAVPKEPGT